MRTILAIIFMTFATQASTADRSGMFVCTPDSSEEKPIIYMFDGNYLIRDNNLEIPFTKVSSLTDYLDLYFAFEPTSYGERKLILQQIISQHPERFVQNLQVFSESCSTTESFYDFFEVTGHKLKEIINFRDQKISWVFKSIKCDRYKTKTQLEDLLSPIENKDFNHKKLTINFNNMTVIEETIFEGGIWTGRNGIVSGGINGNETQKKYQCKSLGIDVPEVDTSKSIVPLASDT